MRIDWWGYTKFGGILPTDGETVFACDGGKHGKIILVESLDEMELVEAFQLIYGAEVKIELVKEANLMTYYKYRGHYSRVYGTWDPYDPNRR